MKNLLKFFYLIAGFFFIASCSNSSANQQAEFYVRGNCGMCENRIEETVKNISGVQSFDYTVDSKMLKIGFDSTKVSELDLHKAVAAIGHGTKEVAMDEKAHAELPECCQEGFNH